MNIINTMCMYLQILEMYKKELSTFGLQKINENNIREKQSGHINRTHFVTSKTSYVGVVAFVFLNILYKHFNYEITKKHIK